MGVLYTDERRTCPPPRNKSHPQKLVSGFGHRRPHSCLRGRPLSSPASVSPCASARSSSPPSSRPPPPTARSSPSTTSRPTPRRPESSRQIYVNLGEHVSPGELLIRMDDADARARLATAQASLTAAATQQADLAHGGTQDERNTNAADLTRTQLQLQQDQTNLASLEKLVEQRAPHRPPRSSSARQRIQADQNSIKAVQQHSTNRYAPGDLSGAQARIADAAGRRRRRPGRRRQRQHPLPARGQRLFPARRAIRLRHRGRRPHLRRRPPPHPCHRLL